MLVVPGTTDAISSACATSTTSATTATRIISIATSAIRSTGITSAARTTNRLVLLVLPVYQTLDFIRSRFTSNSCCSTSEFKQPCAPALQLVSPFDASAMRELVHVQAGQCGNQIGSKFWEVMSAC
jgi:hypothetical protein